MNKKLVASLATFLCLGVFASCDANYKYTSFTESEKALFTENKCYLIDFCPTNYYEVDLQYLASDGCINYYTSGNSKTEFGTYKAKYDSNDDLSYYGSEKDSYGDTWYIYDYGNGGQIQLGYYRDDGYDYIAVCVYAESDPVETINNSGKGLPAEDANGYYNVDFTTATRVKNIHDQGYYLDGCPTTGEVNVLVIPVEFSDVLASSNSTLFTCANIDRAFNAVDDSTLEYPSVADYYKISSNGKLDLKFDVLNKWYKPSQKSTYYANEIDNGEQAVMNEILAQLDAEGKDLSIYDSDNNGTIDAVVMVNTLTIDSRDGASDMYWAFRYWNFYGDANDEYYEYDGVHANDYLWASFNFLRETVVNNKYVYTGDPVNTYTFIHEFGHVLGADDYYDTSYSGVDGGTYGADVMDSMFGDHNVYTKINYGWITNSRLVNTSTTVDLELQPFETTGDSIIFANNWDPELGAYQEYFIVVYYSGTGLNTDAYFQRSGLIVYHVNASLYTQEEDGVTYYDVYNNNTVQGKYSTPNYLLEFVKSSANNFTYIAGDTLPSNLVDSEGNKLGYSMKINSIDSSKACLAFTKAN